LDGFSFILQICSKELFCLDGFGFGSGFGFGFGFGFKKFRT
jgi:hypothetical protein